MAQHVPPREVSIRKAAAIAELSERTVSRWVSSGKLKARTVQAGPVVAKLVRIAEVMKLKARIRAGRKPAGGRRP
jgi:predicted site-specific integrase-resolvase